MARLNIPEEQNIWPLAEDGRASSKFGMRTHPIYGERRMHNGVDIAAPEGTPIVSVAEGEVIFAGTAGDAGQMVKIKHPNGHITKYMHASKLLVKRGQKVHRGGIIANVGSTGSSTGPHLHFEIRGPNGKALEPLENMAKLTASSAGEHSNRGMRKAYQEISALPTPVLKDIIADMKQSGNEAWQTYQLELDRRGES